MTRSAKVHLQALIWALVIPVITAGIAYAQEEKKSAKEPLPENPFPGAKDKAPPLVGGLGWLNTDKPIEMEKLKGKIVILDFWTFCCINCMHVLPDLAKLEAEFPNQLVVIGVHSAKFDGERDTANIRSAILRYGIKHPVVNDGDMAIWKAYGVRAWPSLVVVDPEGFVLGSLSGEGHYNTLRTVINKLIGYHRPKGTLRETPMEFKLEEASAAETPLRFPGKIVVDVAQNRLVVSDSSHHRVVVSDLAGKVKSIIGTGVAGLADGDFAAAQFNDPQGLALVGDVLYIADTKNHVIRRADLQKQKIETIAGTGKQGYERRKSGPAKTVPLASPWDLLLRGNDLFIAMAGTHQIWKLDLAADVIGSFAGNGREFITDGTFGAAEFSQPSGLSSDGKNAFYVADSEVSAVRKVDLEQSLVTTIVGEGLFDFGDKDGPTSSARLQHALGVAYHDGKVYVADTYNNKIRVIDLKNHKVDTFLGDKKSGKSDEPARFDEPAGITFADGKLYVADTNNHAVRVIDIASKKVTTLEFQGLKPPAKQGPK